MVIDTQQRLSKCIGNLNLKSNEFITIRNLDKRSENNPLTASEILDQLSEKKLQSVIIEGGTKTLQYFIDANLWDEARIFVTKAKLKSGLKGPKINRSLIHNSTKINEDILITLYRDSMISKSS